MSVRRLYRVLVLFFILAITLSAASLAGTTGNISGRITDDHGTGVAKAKVTVVSPSQTVSTTTNDDGFYSILNLAPDTYTVTVSKEGYQTTSSSGITVQADQSSSANVSIHLEVKTIGKVLTSATASVVSRTVTGDLYAVNAQAINSYQGSAGGAETLYSQNGVVGSMPGVVRSIGSGGGYSGNGTLSFRGGSNDQVGFELEGIPLNRSFDSANATSFVTNGLASLEIYTGGEPADAGRSMSGYVNEIIRRGTYPGGADFTGVIGSPLFNHTIQADVFGGTPDRRFTYYVSTLASNADYTFSNRQNLDNEVLHIPANDPGCPQFNLILAANGPGTPLNCAVQNTLNVPISTGAWQSFVNPSAAIRDTVSNFHWLFDHNGVQDDLQALYLVGTTGNPFLYAGTGLDPILYSQGTGGSTDANGNFLWPTGSPYIGPLNQTFNPSAVGALTWPSSGGSVNGTMPKSYVDSQSTQESIEKLSYTRSLNSSSFLRVYAYALYSTWNFDQATNGFLGDSFYQLHDHATGYSLNYQNQLNAKNLLRFDADYTKDLTLRYNYAANFFPGGSVLCGLPGSTLATPPTPYDPSGCVAGDTVLTINGPFAYWNDLTDIDSDVALADTWRPSEKWLFDIGLRFDRFQTPLHPLQITGPNGLAEQSQNQFGNCLHGYAYPVGEPCNAFLTNLQAANVANVANLQNVAPGAANWTDVSGSLTFNDFSPRFGATYTLSPRQVLRFSAGRYVQPPATAYVQYIGAPIFGATDTVSVLNRFYDPLGFLAVHNIQPQDSTNYDLSYEQEFGYGLSAKITPYARITRGQILNLPVNPLQPTFITGYNFGAARIKGVEFLLRKNRSSVNGLSGAFSATYTDSKIRFQRSLGGQNFIDVVNTNITAYNAAYGTAFPLLDPNGYYSPSISQSPTSTNASYDVRWAMNLTLDQRANGFDITPTFTYQSGNPYGDPLNFPDPQGSSLNGPDPYTGKFDAPGSLKGPSWLSMNLGVAHDLGKNVKGSILLTNVFTSVHNHGYPWEYPAHDNVVSYGDNSFYNSTPLGYGALSGLPTVQTYYGDNYYPYAPEGLMPSRAFVFSISAKL